MCVCLCFCVFVCVVFGFKLGFRMERLYRQKNWGGLGSTGGLSLCCLDKRHLVSSPEAARSVTRVG